MSPVGRMICSTTLPFVTTQLVRPGRGGNVNNLIRPPLELLEGEGTVVPGRGEAESVIHEVLLPGPVPLSHGPQLRQRRVALVDDNEEIFGEIVEERRPRALPGPCR